MAEEVAPAAVERRFLASATAPVPVAADREVVDEGRGAELMDCREAVEVLGADELLTELAGFLAAAVAAPVVVVDALFSLLGEPALLGTAEVRRTVLLVSSSEADTLGRER